MSHDEAHEEHASMLAWVGGRYDAEAFDLAATNAHRELVDRNTRRRRRKR